LRIAIFDYKIVATNPIGSCHLRLLRDLAGEHQFTVFAVEFENPWPERIEWVRIPVPTRPLALLFVVYHVLAPLAYLLYRFRKRVRFDLVQMVESNLVFGDVSYSHFCHTAFLNEHWSTTPGRGLRRFLRWLDHRLHAWFERRTYRRVRRILVPSRGLGSELARQFPFTSRKVSVLPNAVDVERLHAPPDFDRTSERARLGFTDEDTVFVFVALGQFERKGLPLLLEALSRLGTSRAKLIVVGGEADLIASYRAEAARGSLQGNVVFAGMQADVRPFFWVSDAFAFPSSYETFSLVSYEAAAAGLPVIAPPLNGIEDLVRDGDNGFVIARTIEGVTEGLRRFLGLPGALRLEMGSRARAAAAGYNQARFSERWRAFYREWMARERSPGLKHVNGNSAD
jgi:glycosyltransferase involved in cell wall biosynthesis